MRNKLHKLVASTLLAGVAALLLAPSAEARREPHPTTTTTEPSYVPPYGQNPHPDLGPEVDPYAPGDTPAIVPVDLGGVLPVVSDPGAGDAGDGNRLAPAPSDTPSVLAGELTHPKIEAPSKSGGILSRTGAETMPLVRAGLAALTLGAGLVMLARRRRSETISA
jgi:hypothetical protein